MRVAFNQDASCVVCGTSRGFRVYNCSPFGRFYASNEVESGLQGVGLAEMFFSTSLVAVTGSAENTAENTSPRQLAIVNTKKLGSQSIICELTFPTAIRALKLNQQRLGVALDAQIYLYDISNMKLLRAIDGSHGGVVDTARSGSNWLAYAVGSQRSRSTSGRHDPVFESSGASSSVDPETLGGASSDGLNDSSAISPELAHQLRGDPQSISPISTTSDSGFLANSAQGANSTHKGVTRGSGDVVVYDMDNLSILCIVHAHRSPVAALALNEDGSLLATSSDKGTLVRVFAVPSGTLLHEFRRGSYSSQVYSLAFSLGSRLLCVSSATQTVHIYQLHNAVTSANSSKGENSLTKNSRRDSKNKRDHSEPSTPELRSKKSTKDRWFSGASASRDFAYFKLPLKHNVRTTLAIAPLTNTIYAASETGKLFCYQISDQGGECKRLGEYSLN